MLLFQQFNPAKRWRLQHSWPAVVGQRDEEGREGGGQAAKLPSSVVWGQPPRSYEGMYIRGFPGSRGVLLVQMYRISPRLPATCAASACTAPSGSPSAARFLVLHELCFLSWFAQVPAGVMQDSILIRHSLACGADCEGSGGGFR